MDRQHISWPVALLAAIVAGCAPAPPTDSTQPISELAGRTAGQAQRCVATTQTGSLRVADPGTLLYGTGRTLWVNKLRSDCPGLDRGDALIVETMGGEYCRGDHVRSLDRVSTIPGPACILGDFVPYRK